MTAHILVVDAIPANLKLLEARLLAEYFEVLTAENGSDAIELCRKRKVDVVLLDTTIPSMDGIEICRQLKADSATTHIPVVMMTSLDQRSHRVDGLEAGADDFLTKPMNDLQLLTRVRNLVRLKALTDELRLRAEATRDIGVEQLSQQRGLDGEETPQVLLINEDQASSSSAERMLHGPYKLDVSPEPQKALNQAAEGAYECIIVGTGFTDYDPLRLCTQLRARERTSLVPVILLADNGDEELITRGLELAVNDYVLRPIEQQELLARLRIQVRRKRYNDHLRARVAQTVEIAIIDGLTGLNNRYYFDDKLKVIFDRAVELRQPLSVVFIDLDRLKSVNDTYGHDAGSAVLRECGRLLRQCIRNIDIACHYGGDEFVVAMPDTGLESAASLAECIRSEIAKTPIALGNRTTISPISASVGVSSVKRGQDTVSDLMKRVDLAVYRAKAAGRNRVIIHSN